MKKYLDGDQVRECYRAIFGREAESDAVVEAHVNSGATLESFLRRTLQSSEFLQRGNFPSSMRRRFANLSTSLDVEVSGTPKQMAALLAHMKDVWTKYGVYDPYYSVLTNNQYKLDVINKDSIREFYQEGEGDYSFIRKIIENNGMSIKKDAVVVDFGCGLGRIGAHFASRFGEYIGVDISAPHIKKAEQHFREIGLNRSKFLILPSFLKDKVSADLVFSLIVLQHNPPPVIGMLIGRMCEALRPGGILVFQVPTGLVGYRFKLRDYLENLPSDGVMEMHAFPHQEVFRIFRDHGVQLVDVFEHDMIGPIGESTIFVAVKDR